MKEIYNQMKTDIQEEPMVIIPMIVILYTIVAPMMIHLHIINPFYNQ